MSKIIAHRGANKKAPENTIPAFLKAVEMGAAGIETDVHLTSDGKLVNCHNYNVDKTSDGSGFIADMTFEELRRLDFGRYFGEEFTGTKIPTLEETLEAVKGLEIINIEIKSPVKKNTDIVKKTIDTVKDMGLLDKLIISSFDHSLLAEAKEIDARVKTGMLYSFENPEIEEITEDYMKYAKKFGVDALHPMVLFVVDEEYIEIAHKNNISVNAWTVNETHAIESLNRWNCDGIITDIADVALDIIKK